MSLLRFKHFTIRDMAFRNGKQYGLRIEERGSLWTYELVATNCYFKCTMPGLGGNAAVSSLGGDSHFVDCICVDCTVGFELLGGGSNRLTRCHVWGADSAAQRGRIAGNAGALCNLSNQLQRYDFNGLLCRYRRDRV